MLNKLAPEQNPWMEGKFVQAAKYLNANLKTPPMDVYIKGYAEDPNLFIIQYATLIRHFGYESIKATFKLYLDQNIKPLDNKQTSIDQWVLQYSKAVSQNVVPFYDLIRMPLSVTVIEEINALGLPNWLPPADDIFLKEVNPAYYSEIKQKYEII